MSIGTWNLIVNPFFSPFSGRALKTVQLVQCTPRTNSTKKCCLGKMFHFSFCIWYSISILQVSAQIDKMNWIEWWSRREPHVQHLIYITKIVGQTIERIKDSSKKRTNLRQSTNWKIEWNDRSNHGFKRRTATITTKTKKEHLCNIEEPK